MKIEIIKDCQANGLNLKAGQKAQMETSLAKSLIDGGNAKSSEYQTAREKYAESVSVEKAVEVLEDMPRKAEDIIKKIKMTTNKPALELLLTDGRSSVRKAAQSRIEEL